MKRLKQLIKNLIYLSNADLRNELKPTVNLKDLIFSGHKKGL